MDVHSKSVRSYNMSRIKNQNTKPEIIVRRFLFRNGYRYRINNRKLPGCPDIVLPKYKTVIFVNGCFWHVHENCKYFVLPSTNTDFWKDKLYKNAERDMSNISKLRESGWKVLVIWECDLRKDNINVTLNRLVEQIQSLSEKREPS